MELGMSQETFEKYIERLLGEDKVYVVDSESVDDVNDYEQLIADLFELTGNELELESFDGDEGDPRTFRLNVNGQVYTLEVEENHGWIDAESLYRD